MDEASFVELSWEDVIISWGDVIMAGFAISEPQVTSLCMKLWTIHFGVSSTHQQRATHVVIQSLRLLWAPFLVQNLPPFRTRPEATWVQAAPIVSLRPGAVH